MKIQWSTAFMIAGFVIWGIGLLAFMFNQHGNSIRYIFSLLGLICIAVGSCLKKRIEHRLAALERIA